MNYHIMIQDKFLDSYIEDIYEIGAQNNNVFWFRGDKGDSPHVHTHRAVEFLGHDVNHWHQRLLTLTPTDNIFVHWYDMHIADVVNRYSNKLFVLHWGGEFFAEPLWYHASWLYDRRTMPWVKANYGYPQLLWRKNIFKMLSQLSEIRSFKRAVQQQFEIKNRQMGRIDYVLFGQENSADLERTRQLFPAFKALHLPSSYDNNVDLAAESTATNRAEGPLRILLGNSADETNNHLDAFEQLKKLQGINIYCPLSYGNDVYKNMVISEGEKMFGERFHPITEFMTRNDYVSFLNEMDIIYMYHNRSQAWGNIATGIALGKPVFLKRNNTITEYLRALDISPYDSNSIVLENLPALINYEKENAPANIAKLKASASKNKRLSDLKKIMTVYAGVANR